MFHFIDSKKIGAWGWSYGGYVTAMIMAKEPITSVPDPVFSCGISVSPVTSWLLYGKYLHTTSG